MAEPMVEQMAEPMVAQTVEPMVEQTVEPMVAQTAEPMAAQTAEPMVAQTVEPLAEESVLNRLIAVDRDQFARHYWGQQPLLSAAADLPSGFIELLDANAIDELVSRRGLRTPFLRVAKNGTTLADNAFTSPGGVGAGIADQVNEDKLVRLFADGPQSLLHQLLREREAGPDMDAKSQVSAHPAERRRSVQISAREIEAVARFQHRLDQRWFFSPFLNVSLAVAPRLIA